MVEFFYVFSLCVQIRIGVVKVALICVLAVYMFRYFTCLKITGDQPVIVACLLQVIFQMSLCILDKVRDKLLACKDDGEAMTVLGAYLENVTNRDSTLMHVAHTATMSNYSEPNSKVSQILLVIYK